MTKTLVEKVVKTAADLQALPYGKVPRTETQLGLALLRSGVITSSQLRDALQKKKSPKESLLHALEQIGALNAENRSALLSSRLGIPCVRINEMTIDYDILCEIPAPLIFRYKIMPLGMVSEKLVVAITDPADIEALQAINFVSHHVIEVVIAPMRDIHQLIERYLLAAEEEAIISELHGNQHHEDAENNLPVQTLREKASQKPIVKFVDSLLRRAVTLGASDINIRPTETGGDIYYRIDGKLLLQRSINRQLLTPTVCRIKIISDMNIAERRLPQDGHTMFVERRQRIDFRVSVIPVVAGESVVIRVLDKSKSLVDLDGLGLPLREIKRLRNILTHSFGIFLVTGPTGSGKTTTLYAVVNERRSRGPHIITVEDPVEYRLEGIEQIEIKPKIGYTFAEALRHILRHDPDEILIGEMRDYETAEIAVKAALTGHFVMSTLHTNDAPSTITRLVDMNIEPYLINSTLVGVLAQRLVRKICENCKEPDPDPNHLRAFFSLAPDTTALHGAGCAECHHTGYQGRMMVGELLEMSPPLKELVSEGANVDRLRDAAAMGGMTSLTDNALDLVKAGRTTLEEVFRVRTD